VSNKRKQEAMAEVKYMQANADSAKDMKAMKKRPSGRTFDGVTRPSNNTYRTNFDEIFGKKEQDELKESYEQSKRNKKERDNKNKKL
jgi:hypothetical protein|tara:strand:+ start:3496 stop:3756 length:261 start_codon:yes stop_codon:yes gene_type:complete